MKPTRLVIAAVLAGLGGYGLYRLGERQGSADASAVAATAPAGTAAGADGRRVLYWHDPMVPGRKFDKPGKSPFMDMQLVPVYADAGADEGTVSVSPRVQQNLGIRTAEVVSGSLAGSIEAVGSIAFNERDQAVVQARATGYVERLHVRATLDAVKKGQRLADLYVPEWIAAQEEFLAVQRMQGEGLGGLVDAARQRMRLSGMDDGQVRLVERSGKVQPRIAVVAPIDGVLVELAVREGMTVMPGATLFRISGLGTVWADADVPESQSALLRPGTAVEARAGALPGTTFQGRVQALLPRVDADTRTVKARIELANRQGRLLPGMFVTMSFATARGQALLVPSEAVIRTGRRSVVMVAEGAAGFRPVDIETGGEAGGLTEVRRGLQAGQQVVVSGQFLLDSEASLRATGGRMEASPADAAASAASAPVASSSAAGAGAEYGGQARIEAVGSGAVTLSHGPIPALGWGAMTMEFGTPPAGLPAGLAAGQSVDFAFRTSPQGRPVLSRIGPAGAGDTGGTGESAGAGAGAVADSRQSPASAAAAAPRPAGRAP